MANITLNPSNQPINNAASNISGGPLLTGLGFKLLIREETSYGELFDDSDVFDDFEDYIVELLPGGLLSKTRNTISTSRVLTGGYSDNEFVGGTEAVTGSYTFPLTYEDMDLILDHALGNTHTVDSNKFTNLLDVYSGRTGLGFMEVYAGLGDADTNATGYDDGGSFYTYYSGNKISSFSFNCPSNQSFVTCTMNIVGKEEQLLGQPVAEFDLYENNFYGVTATQELTAKTNFPSWATEIHLDDGSNRFRVPFYDLTITVDNGFTYNNFIDGNYNSSGDTRNIVQTGKRNITGSFRMPFFHGLSNNSTKQFVSSYLAMENFALDIIFNDEDTNKVLKVICPNIKFFDGTSPKNINFSEASCNMSFKAFKNSSTLAVDSELYVAYQ